MHEELKNQIVRTEIVEFTTNRPKFGRRGSPRIPVGTKLFAIRYLNAKGGYYTYSYMDRADAEESRTNQQLYQTNNEFYYPWNVKYDIQDTMHVSPRTNKRVVTHDDLMDRR